MRTETYGKYKTMSLEATWHQGYRAKEQKYPTLVYLHGGGLIYGHRDDLPQAYIDVLVGEGFNVVTLDYPLVPEARLPEIVSCLEQGIQWVNAHSELSDDYVLFGRSAGAYLSLLLAHRTRSTALKGVVSFYGYPSLEELRLTKPSAYYQEFGEVPLGFVKQLIQVEPLKEAKIEARFPLYMAYRQQGTWVQEILGGASAGDYSVSDQALRQMPPTFIAASTGDQDVPFSLSKEMSLMIPHNQFHEVHDSPHDFDRDPNLPVNITIYKELVLWLKAI